MKTTFTILAFSILAAACGDNKQRPDARVRDDGPPADAYCSNCPAAPTLGAQIDRMGRPTINTALTHGFSVPATAAPEKDEYNQDSNPSGWVAANAAEFMKNLAIIDSLDTGLCGNGLCETGEVNVGPIGGQILCAADCPTANQIGDIDTGCGNQVLYNTMPGGGGDPAAESYQTLAGILAADELYVDLSRSTCAFYLAVEFGVATALGNTTCGGRAPSYDVIDFTLSAAAVGIQGFVQPGFVPKFGDGATVHDDLTDTFPFLGAPNTP